MLYLLLSFLSGIISGGITIYFRLQEIKTQTIIFGKHIFSQIILFFILLSLFQNYFSHIKMVFPYITLSWFWIFFIVSSMSYYMVQIFFEYFTDKKFFAPKEELEAYLEKLEDEKNKF
ncbi:hypothetical protein LAT59_00315 [Candidatus Gracilibacteria bacterium]|nr:hypothetical protein [Candidatus Gracilibacteria bacterium]